MTLAVVLLLYFYKVKNSLARSGKIGDVSTCRQESNPTTRRLGTNLAISSIDFNLGRELTDTFIRSQYTDLRAYFNTENLPFHNYQLLHIIILLNLLIKCKNIVLNTYDIIG